MCGYCDNGTVNNCNCDWIINQICSYCCFIIVSFSYIIYYIFNRVFDSFRITYVQSTTGVATPLPLGSTTAVSTPQRAAPPHTQAFLPSAMATLGFTAIAPAGPTLVHPIVAGECNGQSQCKQVQIAKQAQGEKHKQDQAMHKQNIWG